MKVTANAKDLQDVIKDIARAVEQAPALTLEAGKCLVVSAQNAGKSIAIKVKNSSVESKGSFSVKPEILTGILKNRKDINLELVDNEVSFKAPSAKGYAGKFTTLPTEKVDIESESTTLSFDDDFITALNSIISATSINDVHLGKMNPLPLFLKISSKGLEVSCCNDSHLAYARVPTSKFKSDALLCVPAGSIPLINSIAKNSSYKLAATESSLFALNDTFKYRIPLEQFDQAISIDDAKTLLKQLKSAKVAGTITVKADSLVKSIDNLLSVYEENAPVEFLIKKEALRLRTKTSYGEVSDQLKGNDCKDTSDIISIHPYILNDILSRIKAASVRLSVIKGKCLLLETKSDSIEYTYSCILL